MVGVVLTIPTFSGFSDVLPFCEYLGASMSPYAIFGIKGMILIRLIIDICPYKYSVSFAASCSGVKSELIRLPRLPDENMFICSKFFSDSSFFKKLIQLNWNYCFKNMNTFIPAKEISADLLISPFPPRFCTTRPPQNEQFCILPVFYGQDEFSDNKEPLFKMQIAKGRIEKKIRDGKESLRLKLTIKNKDDIAGLCELNKGFRNSVFKYKRELKLPYFGLDRDCGDVMHTIKFAKNEMTGEIISGAAHKLVLKIDDRSIFQKPRFVDASQEYVYNTIQAKDLLEKEILCSVIINPRHLIKWGAPVIPQIFVRSCAVLDIKQIEVEHTMGSDIKDFLDSNRQRIDLMNKINKVPEPYVPITPTPTLPTQVLPTSQTPSLQTFDLSSFSNAKVVSLL